MISAGVRRSVLLLSFATFSSMTAQRICDAMLPELAREFSVSLARAAQVVSFFAAVYGVAQLVHGPLGDRIGKYRLVTIATAACSVGSLLAVFAPSIDALVLARVLVAGAVAAIIPMSMAWVGDTVEPHHVQETLARLGLGSTFGILGGQLSGGLLTDAWGWRWAFVFMTVLFAAVAALLWREMRNLPEAAGNMAHPATKEVSFVRQMAGIVTGPWSGFVLCLALAEGAAGFGVLAMWASHLHRVHGLSLTLSGLVVGLFGLGGVAYMVVARHLIHRFGQSGLALLGGALVCAGAAVVAYAPWWWLAVPASSLAGFGFFMFHNTIQANAAQMAPQARGIAVSLFASFLFTGQSLGVIAAAALIGWIGTAPVIGLGGVCMLALGLLFSVRLRHKERSTSRILPPA